MIAVLLELQENQFQILPYSVPRVISHPSVSSKTLGYYALCYCKYADSLAPINASSSLNCSVTSTDLLQEVWWVGGSVTVADRSFETS